MIIREHSCLALDDDCMTCMRQGAVNCQYADKRDCPIWNAEVKPREERNHQLLYAQIVAYTEVIHGENNRRLITELRGELNEKKL